MSLLVARIGRPLAALAALTGLLMVALTPTSAAAGAAGLLVAVVVVALASFAARAPIGSGAPSRLDASAAVGRLVPRGTQSDPDANGHARPRAPGELLPAL